MDFEKQIYDVRVLFVAIIVLAVISTLNFFWQELTVRNYDEAVLTRLATTPDNHLFAAKEAAVGHAYKGCKRHIEKAIYITRIIEEKLDDRAKPYIEIAIAELRAVEEEVDNHQIDINHLNLSFAEALNALAYANLQISQTMVTNGNAQKAEQSIQYAMIHLQNSMKFSNVALKEEELEIFNDLKALYDEHHIDHHVLSASLTHLEAMIVEHGAAIK